MAEKVNTTTGITTKNVIFLSASQYDFEDKGKVVRGTTINYLMTDDLAPRENKEKKQKGYKPQKQNFPFEAFEKVGEVPAVYAMDFDMEEGSDGKLKTVPVDFRHMMSLFE